MSSGTHSEIDPELEEWLKEARAEEDAAPTADFDDMLEGVEQKLKEADRSWTFWLRSRATSVRRAIAFGGAALVVLVAGTLSLRTNLAELPLPWLALAIGSLSVLLGASLYLGLRPLHQPELPGWARGGIIAATVVATCAIALFAPQDTVLGGETLLAHTSPCFLYGMLVGLPVYLLLRLLHRGGSTAALVAACAAGLTGNLVLQLHCPRGDVEHLMVGHFTVVLLFLGGLGAIHWFVERVRSRA